MAVILDVVAERPELARDAELCERIRQVVANRGRTFRLEITKEARIQAFAEASET